MPKANDSPELITMQIPSRLELLGVLDCTASWLCDRMAFDADTSSKVAMSLIEAGTNAIQHGHQRDATKIVDIRFTLYPDRLEIDVHDTGPGFDVESVNGDITSPEHLLDARGRGIYIMRACMDLVRYDFSASGTVCHLVKNRPTS